MAFTIQHYKSFDGSAVWIKRRFDCLVHRLVAQSSKEEHPSGEAATDSRSRQNAIKDSMCRFKPRYQLMRVHDQSD
jgi:hypothetical protein